MCDKWLRQNQQKNLAAVTKQILVPVTLEGHQTTKMSQCASILLLLSPTSRLGWLSVAIIAVVIAIPFLSVKAARPSSLPLWPHYWFGLLAACASFWHAWIPMKAGQIPHSATNGLWLATIALGLLFLQLWLGVFLRYTGPRYFVYIRRAHLFLMLGIVALIVAHLWLNSRFIHSLL
jgi:hypothetical protein